MNISIKYKEPLVVHAEYSVPDGVGLGAVCWGGGGGGGVSQSGATVVSCPYTATVTVE